MNSFKLTAEAKTNLTNIARYTEQAWGKKQRNAYLKQLDDCFHLLAKHPTQGKERPEINPSLRSFAVSKHVVFYSIKPNIVIIVNILHERMDLETQLSRIK